jgi:hypothetical protein
MMTEYQRINKKNIFIILMLGAVGIMGGILTPVDLRFQLPAITFNLQKLISPDVWLVLFLMGVGGLVFILAAVIYMMMGVAGMGGRMR